MTNVSGVEYSCNECFSNKILGCHLFVRFDYISVPPNSCLYGGNGRKSKWEYGYAFNDKKETHED